MKRIPLIILLLIPVYAQTPVEVEIILRTSGTAAQTTAICRKFARKQGWAARVRNEAGQEIDNPETPCNYAERMLEAYVIREIKNLDGDEAGENAKRRAREQVDTEIRAKKVGQ